jgi:hypothetical protein
LSNNCTRQREDWSSWGGKSRRQKAKGKGQKAKGKGG